MSMVTSCPACTTTFRVSPDQLKQKNGKVRCGTCRDVFDAFKSLATMPDDTPAQSPRANVAEATQTAADEIISRQGALAIDQAAIGAAAAALSAQAPSARVVRNRWLWRIVAAMLALLLVFQLAYVWRDALSSAVPGLRPLFQAICSVSGCTVAPPRRSEQLAIVSSDLQADPTRPNVIVLIAALRNRGPSVVAHPALELTLTDAQDQALARRVFMPADYLAQPDAVQEGMTGLAEVSVRIELDTGALRPAGYRLFLFYP